MAISAPLSKLILPSPLFGFLLLRRSRFLRLRLRSLLPHAHQSRITPRQPQRPIRILRPLTHLTPLYLAHRLFPTDILNRQHLAQVFDNLAVLLLCRLHFLLGGIQSLVLPGFAREEDQALTVGFKARDVQRDGFGGEVRAAGVD